MNIYTVYDIKAELHLVPMFFKTNADALRAFETTCRDPQTQFARFPSDFVLKMIGQWDDMTSKIKPLDPIDLATAADFVHHEKRD